MAEAFLDDGNGELSSCVLKYHELRMIKIIKIEGRVEVLLSSISYLYMRNKIIITINY